MADEGIQAIINERIKTLIAIKGDIASAIISLGGSVSKNDSFASYADKIRDLDPKKNLDLTTLNASPGETYRASDEGCDGWNVVKVSGGSSDGSGGSGGGSGSGGSGGSADGSGSESEAPTYTVTFTNRKNNPEDTTSTYYWEDQVVENVPYKGNAELPKNVRHPEKEGNYKFLKWEPAPVNVQADMVCEAVFADLDAEIEDSWGKICENGGSIYEIGQFKTLPIDDYKNCNQWQNWNSGDEVDSSISCIYIPVSSSQVQMCIVAKGEGNSTSTWVTKSWTKEFMWPHKEMANGSKYTKDIYDKENNNDWSTSDIRKWLNSTILNAIPEPVRGSITPVQKQSSARRNLSGVTTTDSLWLLSFMEIFEATASDVSEDLLDVDYTISTNTTNVPYLDHDYAGLAREQGPAATRSRKLSGGANIYFTFESNRTTGRNGIMMGGVLEAISLLCPWGFCL